MTLDYGEEPQSAATRADSAGSYEDGDTIGRNTVSSFATQLATAAFTGVLLLFLVRVLGPKEYGIFALALGVGSLLSLPSDFGISQSTARFVAERRGRAADVAEVLATSLKLKLIFTGAVAVALFVAASPIADAYGEPALTWPLRGMAIIVFAQGIMSLYQYSFVAVGRASIGLRLVLSKSAIELTSSIALVLLGAGLAGAVAGRMAGFAVGALVGTVMVLRLFGRRALSIRGSHRQGMRRLAGYAGALMIVDGAYAAFTQIDVLLIGAILGTASVGLYQPALRLVDFLHQPGLSVAYGVAPRLARHERHLPNVRAFRQALRGLVIFQAVFIAPVAVWAGPITGVLLGPDYTESADVLRALAPYIFISGIGPLVSVSVNYLGHARARIPVVVTALVINAALDLLLLPRVGIVGAAIGTDAAYLIYVGGHLLLCRRLLGVSLHPLLVTLARSLLAASGMAAVLLIVGTTSLSIFEWVIGGGGGLAAFLAILVLTREVSAAEMRAAPQALAAGLRRAPA